MVAPGEYPGVGTPTFGVTTLMSRHLLTSLTGTPPHSASATSPEWGITARARVAIHLLTRRPRMNLVKEGAQSALLLTLVTLASACVLAPREDYYDRDHHRYYHEHAWHDCGDHDDHCR